MATSKPSVASIVLRLPELVNIIFKFLDNDDDMSALAACMQVNRLWAEEAVGLLWRTCGSGPPDSSHLASMAESPDRLQWYARYITMLFFRRGASSPGSSEYAYEVEDEAQHHHVFKDISFPRLAWLEVTYPLKSTHVNGGSEFLPYLQPSLVEFRLLQGALSDQVLLSMQTDMWKTRCTTLKLLTLDLAADTGAKAISERGLTDFLKNMRQLSRLNILSGFEELWSFHVLAVLAQHPSLETLEIPDIPDNWISNLVGNSTMQLFPKLNSLGTGLSEFGLEMLLPHLEEIFGLNVTVSGQSTKALRLVADIPGMRVLSFSFNPRSIICGEDLIRLAENSRGLEQLELPAEPSGTEPPCWARIPSARGITDATIDEVARLLPELDMLRLDVQNSPLTEMSLLSLGTHCKKLTHCYIAAEISFEELRCEALPGLFPELVFLQFDQPRSTRRRLRDVDETARWFVREAPKLVSFRIYGHYLMSIDLQIDDAINDLLRSRMEIADDE